MQIFKDRGIEVDFQPALGKDKEKLAATVGNYDGLAIRSATKVTSKVLEQARNLKVIGRAGIGVDNVDIPAATARGIIVMAIFATRRRWLVTSLCAASRSPCSRQLRASMITRGDG